MTKSLSPFPTLSAAVMLFGASTTALAVCQTEITEVQLPPPPDQSAHTLALEVLPEVTIIGNCLTGGDINNAIMWTDVELAQGGMGDFTPLTILMQSPDEIKAQLPDPYPVPGEYKLRVKNGFPPQNNRASWDLTFPAPPEAVLAVEWVEECDELSFGFSDQEAVQANCPESLVPISGGCDIDMNNDAATLGTEANSVWGDGAAGPPFTGWRCSYRMPRFVQGGNITTREACARVACIAPGPMADPE